MTDNDKYARMANAIRFLSVDAVLKAGSGYPGLPMGGMADVVTVLFSEFMKFDPKVPDWPDRDRFILSAGHGSIMLYCLLYLLGYEDIDINQIKNFRQLGAKTAAHPEYGHAAGGEITTAPPGQGIASAVGMAIAERKLMDEFGKDIINHHTCCLVGNDCLMEGVSQEAIALAGHLKLNRLIALWDDNQISMDKPVSISDSTDQIARFNACNWKTISVNCHNTEEVSSALQEAQSSDKPVMIACRSIVGSGSPDEVGMADANGSSFGKEEVARMREALGWKEKPFQIPPEILDEWRIVGLRSKQKHKEWGKRFCMMDAEAKGEFQRRMRGDLPSTMAPAFTDFKHKLAQNPPEKATHESSAMMLEIINAVVKETIGGSADLASSSNTRASQTKIITPDDFSGRYIHWGVREHAMAAAMNGMALQGGFIPYSEGSLAFSDCYRAPIRLAAMMGIRCIHVLTHDSVDPGEDGPTHQPVEHLAALRAIPNLLVMRPADAMETAECWQLALESQSAPSVLTLSRQVLPVVRKEYNEENRCSLGAYELNPASDIPQVSLFASGSEVRIALEAQARLEEERIATRVISVPCFELFETQRNKYQAGIIGEATVNIAIEAGVRQGWGRFIGSEGIFIGMNSFGYSAPMEKLYKHFGITPEAVVRTVKTELT